MRLVDVQMNVPHDWEEGDVLTHAGRKACCRGCGVWVSEIKPNALCQKKKTEEKEKKAGFF